MKCIEQEFIKQINAKQDEAYRKLFQMFYRYLVLYALRFVQLPEIAEDIVQEVFLSIWKGDKHYNSFYGLRSFLYESVKNRCLNHLNHKKIEQAYIDYSLQIAEEEEEDVEDYELMREEIYRKIYQVVAELPEGCRKVFEQHLQGKKNEEIAALLNLSIETVKSQKKKALRVLRERLGDLYLLCVLLKMV